MSTLEDRLTAALAARAEQVTPTNLSPTPPPATVIPLRSRVRPTGYVVAAAAAAAAIVVAVSLADSSPRSAEPAPPLGPTTGSTSSPTTAPSPADTTTESVREQSEPEIEPADDTADLAGLLPAAPSSGRGIVELGGSTTLADGTVLTLGGRPGQEVIDPGGDVRFTVTSDGVSRSLVLAQGLAPRVLTTTVVLGPDGPVLWVLGRTGGDQDTWTVVVDAGTRLIPLLPAYPDRQGPILGAGLTGAGARGSFASWIAADGSGLYTRVTPGSTAPARSSIYRWGITGPAAGPQLTLTSLGRACSDSVVDPTSYARC